jgi:Zn-dependent protease
MASISQGSIRLFRVAGIDVFLHWFWFLVAAFEISSRTGQYSSIIWNILEYLGLFLIVLLHEFGHALACRQVGGTADQIVLWPLGGIAYVSPPPRPGANLWSIAAGPLVNVALVPVFKILTVWSFSAGWAAMAPNAFVLLGALAYMNVVLLIFNLLPIYPLDGGQILRSLLWFVIGRARSLMVVTLLGFAASVVLIIFAVWMHFLWIGFVSVYMLMNCWGGWKQARQLLRSEQDAANQVQVPAMENAEIIAPESSKYPGA